MIFDMANYKFKKNAITHWLLSDNLECQLGKKQIFRNNGVFPNLRDDFYLLYISGSSYYFAFPSIDSAISFIHLNHD